jgi:hypothetical protein
MAARASKPPSDLTVRGLSIDLIMVLGQEVSLHHHIQMASSPVE